MTITFYYYSKDSQINQLKNEMQLVSRGVELEGIDYVMYYNKSWEKFYLLNLIDNVNATVENTGDSWNEAAYGNCLIFLNNANVTDRLYLLTKESLNSIGRIDLKNVELVESILTEKTTRIVERLK